MSRVAKKPISLPKGVECVVGSDRISVKGPKGTLTTARHHNIDVKIENDVLQLAVGADAMAMAGTLRALLNNMVAGVTTGYERKRAVDRPSGEGPPAKPA